MLKPTPEKLLIEIIEIGEHRAQEAAKRIPGFQIPPPPLEGVPNTGRVYMIGEDVRQDGLKAGDLVFFNEQRPKGFRWEGKRLFAMLPEQILAVITEPAV